MISNINADTPFKNILDTNKATGLSVYFLRQGVRNGTIPHIRAGKKYLINVPLLIEQLNKQSIKP